MTSKPYLTGHYTPVVDEVTATELTVEGTLPPELTGRLIRNGHNPKPGVTPTHWFKGSGMVHGIRLREGRAEWYRNRWVHTPALDGAPYMTEHGPDLTASAAGTHVIEHAGRLLALCEANVPFELTPELETVGAYDFDGKLRSAMTAHPKEDPVTGELHFFGSSPFPPFLTYYVADAKGEIVHSAEIPGATASLKHDFALTRRHVVFIEGNVTFDPAEHSGIPYGWSDAQPARIGIMPRGTDGRRAGPLVLHRARQHAARRQRLRGRPGPDRPGGPHRGPRGLPALLELVGRRPRPRHRARRPLLHPPLGGRPGRRYRRRADHRRPRRGVPDPQRGLPGR